VAEQNRTRRSRRVNPDYDRDGVVTDRDTELKRKDKNKDGTVTSAEEREYFQSQGEQITTYEYDAEGNLISQKTTSKADAPRRKTVNADDFGYSKAFLDKHPDVRQALNKAIKFGWEPEQFVNHVETKTQFGRRTTDSQAAFAIGISGPKKEEWQQRVEDNFVAVTRAAESYGIRLSEDQRRQYATNMVRNGLDQNDMLGMFAYQYGQAQKKPAGGQGQAPTAAPATGQVALITDSLKELARSYGYTMTDDGLQMKVQQAIKQGEDWRTWLAGQEDSFRQKAKMLYPTVADQLDRFNMDEILDPYMETAAATLGYPRSRMQNNDPMWTAALSGENGPMSNDEWVRTLRTNDQYGWTKTSNAKKQIVGQMSSFLSLFGAV
jgi:hypothetical protein